MVQQGYVSDCYDQVEYCYDVGGDCEFLFEVYCDVDEEVGQYEDGGIQVIYCQVFVDLWVYEFVVEYGGLIVGSG